MSLRTGAKCLLLFCILLLLSACRGKPDIKEMGTDEESFARAMELYRKKDYWQAKPAFTELRDKFPLSPYAVLAELRLGDIHYFNEEYVEAVHFYEEFKRLHPSNPDVPYAIFQLGMCYFKQVESFDRDQTPAEKAADFFRYLIKNYPSSPFVGSAMGKYKICRQRMFEHDFSIGRFYYKSKKYWAAKERFTGVLSQYEFISNRDEVLYYLGMTYRYLNDEAKADEVLTTLVREFPQSAYGQEARALLGSVTDAEDAPAGTVQPDNRQGNTAPAGMP